MKELTIKDIIKFRSKSERSKKNFAADLKRSKEKVATAGGGDYWISCTSAINNSFKANDLQFITNKIDELKKKSKETHQTTRIMYKRNIDILYKYENFDLKKWRPANKIKLLNKHKEDSVLTIKGFQIKIAPHHVFTFQRNSTEETGAIWFVAKLDGFRKEELGMFSDILYTYLKIHFSKEHNLNPKYCIAVDIFNNHEINYAQIEKREVAAILNPTLDELKKLI